VTWSQQAPTLAQRLGLRVAESALTGIKVSHVLRGGAAEAAGLSAGDELLGVDDWRLRRLDDLLRLLPDDGRATLLVSRDQRLLHLPLVAAALPDSGAVVLSPAGAAAENNKAAVAAQSLRQAWMRG
jgi:predicted metalloprotease with PDZ domain